MKFISIIFSVFLLLLISSCKGIKNEAPQREYTNVVLILADDLGWKDLSCYGSSFYETPNIDALAKDGQLFTNGYASCPVCSPSRASIQTGLYPTQVGITDWIPGRATYNGSEEENRWLANDMKNQLDLEYTTIAELLKENDYSTFFAGKWHLGETDSFWPESQGYEINKGGFSRGRPNIDNKIGANGYFSPYDNPRLKDGPEGEYLTDRLGDETVKFISENKDNPFFVSLSFYQVHTPLQAKKELIEKYEKKRAQLGIDTLQEIIPNPNWIEGNFKNKSFKERIVQGHPTYAGMVQSLDENVGKVINRLKELGLYENTLIIFTSDNGGLSTSGSSPTSNFPLRGGKGWLFEGGIRVPFIVRRPNEQEKGSVKNYPVSGIDVFPTILNYLKIDKKDSINGVDILAKNNPERPLFWHYPHYGNQGGNPGSAIRKGKYKLIHDFETGGKMLFDLENDLGEQHNLINQLPDIAEALYNELDTWRKNDDAVMMRLNPIWNKKEKIIE
jgi:arylsulfatase A-like enzyme